LYKTYGDEIVWKPVNKEEMHASISHCHDYPMKTMLALIKSRPRFFEDVHEFVKVCDRCQKDLET